MCVCVCVCVCMYYIILSSDNVFIILYNIVLSDMASLLSDILIVLFDCIMTVSLLRDLKHANIVTLHDIIHTDKSLTLVFEYLVSTILHCVENTFEYLVSTI